MAIKRVILHVGMHKTGTSSIQDTLYYNSRILKKNGILYLTEWGINQVNALYNLIPTKRSFSISYVDISNTGQRTNNYQEQLFHAAKTSNCHTLVISSEAMFVFPSEHLLQLKEYFRQHLGNDIGFKFILYIRNPATLATSAYQQALISPCDDVKPYKAAFSYMRWLEFHCRECIIAAGQDLCVYKFEDAINDPHGLVGHFLKSVGIVPEDIAKIRMYRANESRCQEASDFLQYISKSEPLVIKTCGLDGEDIYLPNTNRSYGDITLIASIKGARFFLSESKKTKTVVNQNILWIKENFGINYEIPRLSCSENQYTISTLHDFEYIFPYLSINLKQLFLNFFEEKFHENKRPEFKRLFEKKSLPYRNYLFAQQIQKIIKEDPELISANRRIFYDGFEPMYYDYGELFINYGEGGRPENVIRFNQNNKQCFAIQVNFQTEDNVRFFRFDPSLYSGIILFTRFLINGNDAYNYIQSSNSDFIYGDIFCFFTDDPQIYISHDEIIHTIEAEYLTDTGSYAYSLFARLKLNCMEHKFLNEKNEMQRELQELTHNISSLQNEKTQMQSDLRELTKNISLLRKEKEGIFKSTCWKIIKSIRKLLDLLIK